MMNKKEQAEMEALRDELRIARALRFTEKIEPDVDIPTSTEESEGYMFNAYSQRVTPSRSRMGSHLVGECSWSQQGKRLYSTELLAYTAMRYEVERDCAKKLAVIDKKIESLRQA
jgi:hypothetical protein